MEKTAGAPVYTESSFLISLYSPDVNTVSAVAALHAVSEAPIITPLVEFEVINALQQRVFWKQITAAEARRSHEKFERNKRNGAFRVFGLPDSIFSRASGIAERTTAARGTRSIDLLHAAAAVELGAGYLYSFDERQRKLAKSLRLKLN